MQDAILNQFWDSLGRIFSILQGPPPLLDLLYDSLLQSSLLQLPVEVLYVEGRELLVGHADAKDVLGTVPRHAAVVRHWRLGRPVTVHSVNIVNSTVCTHTSEGE